MESSVDTVAGLVVVAVMLASPTELVVAQLAEPSARSAALATSYLGRARGFEAPFWNPANLGLSDRPSWSFGLASVSGYVYNNSLTIGQITGLF